MENPVTQQARETAVGASVPHESAELHVAGDATYVDDIAELAGTRFIALGLSSQAHARITSINLEAVRAAPGVVAVITAADIPGHNDCGPIIADDPILAAQRIQADDDMSTGIIFRREYAVFQPRDAAGADLESIEREFVI